MREHPLFQETNHTMYLYVILQTLHSKHILNLDVYVYICIRKILWSGKESLIVYALNTLKKTEINSILPLYNTFLVITGT